MPTSLRISALAWERSGLVFTAGADWFDRLCSRLCKESSFPYLNNRYHYGMRRALPRMGDSRAISTQTDGFSTTATNDRLNMLDDDRNTAIEREAVDLREPASQASEWDQPLDL